jgi:ABC-2 type transport system permease protein
VVFRAAPSLRGWDADSALVFLTLYLTIENMAIITFHRNLFYYLPDMIRKGEFDFLLVKPVSALFHTSFRVIDCMDGLSMVAPFALWVAVFVRNPPLFNLGTLFTVILFFLLAYLFLFELSLLVASTAFWTLTATGTGRAFEGIMRIARYPTDFFPSPLRFVLSVVFPLSFIAVVPAKIILGMPLERWMMVGAATSCMFILLGIAVWKRGLKKYASASS